MTEPRTPSKPPTPAQVRTHLANERTFLAWVRTGFAVIALGLGAAQLLDRHRVRGIELSQLLATVLVLFGFVLVLIGRIRYRQTAIGIRDNTYRQHRRGLEVALVGTAVVTLLALAFILRT
jgi:putative membrane protein